MLLAQFPLSEHFLALAARNYRLNLLLKCVLETGDRLSETTRDTNPKTVKTEAVEIHYRVGGLVFNTVGA